MQSGIKFEPVDEIGPDLIDRLYPKALVNHLSKLPELGNTSFSEVVARIEGITDHRDPQLTQLLATISAVVSSEDVEREAQALYLSMHNREDEVRNEFPDKVSAFDESDRNQAVDAHDPRTLDYYLRHGLTVSATTEDKARAHSTCANDRRDVPIIEKLKAERLLTINGFVHSRVMYLIHDMLDHGWLFNHLRDMRIFTHYHDFLISIDMNPATAFLYSRQAEILSTIGFGTRRWALAKSQGERLVTQDDDILAIIGSGSDSRTDHALRVYEEMTADNREWTRSVIENMVVQIADERRRWGAIKQRQSDGQIQGVTKLLDPLHLSLLIEATNAVQQCETYRTVQLEAMTLVDGVLERELLQTGGDTQFRVDVPRGVGAALAEADLSKIEWFRQHLDFSTCYNPIPL
jgi:hypothetical protein